jgi:hypothetical protein
MTVVNRHQHRLLKEMGVDIYLPRFPLPGAPASSFYVEVEPATGSRDEPDSIEAATRSRPVDARGVLDDLQHSLDEKPARAPIAPGDVAESPDPERVPEEDVFPWEQAGSQAFRLALYHPVPGLLVMVDANHSEAVHLQLLASLLRALGLAVDALVPVDVFCWPPESHSVFSGDDVVAASELLNSMLEGFGHKHQVTNVLVLGEQFGQLILLDRHDDELFCDVELHGINLRIIPGLQSMLDDPANKKQAWTQLRSLCGSFHS